MRERVLLFCLLGLVLAATIMLVTAPKAVPWALAPSNKLPRAKTACANHRDRDRVERRGRSSARTLLIVLAPLTEGEAFLGRRGLNRPFRDGHHITRSHHPAYHFGIRRLELPHVAAEVIAA